MDTIPTTSISPAPRGSAHLTGVVIKIVDHVDGEWAEILIEGAEHLYREIRVTHPLQNEDGTSQSLKVGDRVSIFIKHEL